MPSYRQFLPSLIKIPYFSPAGRGGYFKFIETLREKDTSGEKGGNDIFMTYSATHRYLLSNAEFASKVMITESICSKPLEDYQALRGFGENVVSTIGEEWRKHRNICNPAFTDQTMKLLCKLIQRSSKSYFNYFEKKCNGENSQVMDVLDDVKKLTFDAIVNVGFGLKVDSFSDEKKDEFKFNGKYTIPFTEAISKSLIETVIYNALVPVWFRSVLRVLPFNNFGKRIENQTREASRYIDEIIDFKTKNTESLNKFDLISGFLKADDKLTIGEVKSNIYIMLFAGHDTVSTTISWALYELSKNPDIQDKARNYIKTQIGNKQADFEDIEKLGHITNIIKETLRFHTPIPILTKKALKNFKLGKWKIKKGSSLVINIQGIHHDKRYWNNPDQFIPERFEKKPVYGSFMPFSLGTRKCIGFNFAYIEGTMLLTSLLQKFKFELVKGFEDVKTVARITHQPDNLKLKLTKV